MNYSPPESAQPGTSPRITLLKLIVEATGLLLFLCSALALSALAGMILR